MKRVLVLMVLSTGLAALPAPGLAASGLSTGVIANPSLHGANDELQFARIRSAGATFVTIPLAWDDVAPINRPEGFDAANPADPGYRWSLLDQRVRLAHSNGLQPVLAVSGAPLWAQGKIPPTDTHTDRDGPYRPSPAGLGKFAAAVATRYSGSFGGLPRVRYYVAWNEPNIYRYLTPQRVNGKPYSPIWYRKLLTALSASVHAVHSDNEVIAGALAPFGIDRRISPMTFMRELLCMSGGEKPHPTCPETLYFDIWSHHPYTRGNPFHHASSANDISLGDLPKMRALLNAAVKAHQVDSRRKVQFWVDEFSYDSHPPDPSKYAVPIPLHARWTAESLYQMWRSGVTVATWFLIRDESVSSSPFQSGLYFEGASDDLRTDRPKPALMAFRFPFVAYRGTPPPEGSPERSKSFVSVWGRTPSSKAGPVSIEVGTKYGWRRVARMEAKSGGIFTGELEYAAVQSGMKSATLKSSYKKVVLADKPRSYWRLDERSGSVAKDELHRANGTYKGASTHALSGALKGKGNKAVSNRAVSFDGGRVALPAMTPPRAVELWLKTTKQGDLPAASFRDGGQGPLSVGSTDRFVRASGRDSSVGGFNYINDGKWHYVVYTLASGGKARLYVDGRLNDETQWHPLWDESSANLAFDPVLNTHFKGILDEVAIYDQALSPEQIARHYTASGRRTATLGQLRARVGSATSWPFSLKRPRDRFVLAFG